MSDPYIGEIRMMGFNYAPYGWAQCNGQVVNIVQNQALFVLLGTIYGGNGSSNFNLPNLQGRSPVGMGQGLGLSNISIGEQGGVENVSLTTQNMPSHTHVASVTGGGAVTGQISIPATTSTASGTQTAAPGTTAVLGPVSVSDRQGQLYSTATDGATTLKPFNVTLQGTAPAITNSLVGNNTPIALRNPFLGINFCIALQGVYPTRQ
ncbi:phage tail protein [Trinickia dinghuensis]|uniref:Phage tail protein n=1 Tax=Trinickia dinghuensis TaxID=2291023 RepID=A0A3D8JR85_9BURK|nr:tail fiber protein [Trinickia dinghuensis]RDU95054.1 phage tail protein [Trinickia dinghuensis]